MQLSAHLRIHHGVTAVIGSGGKTTLLRTLGEELATKHTVLLCTTTKIRPFPGLACAKTAEELRELRKSCRFLCAGQEIRGTGKLTALNVPMAQLMEWFDYVLVEADGAAGCPLKAHAPHEPVIPQEANQTICVAGASGFGHPIVEAAHRPGRYAKLAGAAETDLVTAEIAAAVLKAEGLHQRVYINQVETLPDLLEAKILAALLDGPVLAGSLHRGEYFEC